MRDFYITNVCLKHLEAESPWCKNSREGEIELTVGKARRKFLVNVLADWEVYSLGWHVLHAQTLSRSLTECHKILA